MCIIAEDFLGLDSDGFFGHPEDMTHPLYSSTADCQDLPELFPEGDEPGLRLAEVAPDVVVAAVSARQAGGGRLQEKVDGCWCCMTVGEGGRLEDPRSRADLPLRFAAAWVGQRVDARFVGWRLIGELEAGTARARRVREDERGEEPSEALYPWHLYAMVDPAGAVHDGLELHFLLSQLVHLDLAGRLTAIREALPCEDWGTFAREVFDRGGEGVVIRQGGACYRAKPQVDFDRYCTKVVSEPDRRGRMRLQAVLAVCTSAGARPRYQAVQPVELPRGMRRSQVAGHVVTIIGASVDQETGVVRHARITRVREDKSGPECRA